MMTNIKKGLVLKGKPAEIPDTTRLDLPEFFKEMGFKVGAEIGVYKGEFTKKFCDVGIKIYGIDPWRAYKDYNRFPTNIKSYQKRQDYLYKYARKVLKDYLESGLCRLTRKTSMEAVENFQDESLDFVYIDGHHGFRYVAEDLVEWTKKVKKGGVVSGHDYGNRKKQPDNHFSLHAIYVLHAYVNAYGINNFFVLGRRKVPGKRVKRVKDADHYYDVYKHNGKEEKRDKWRSWFWIKQ